MEHVPERPALLGVIQDRNSAFSLFPQCIPDLQNGAAVGISTVKEFGVPSKNLFGKVARHEEESMAGEDDGVTREGRISEDEAEMLKLMQGSVQGIMIGLGDGFGDAIREGEGIRRGCWKGKGGRRRWYWKTHQGKY